MYLEIYVLFSLSLIFYFVYKFYIFFLFFIVIFIYVYSNFFLFFKGIIYLLVYRIDKYKKLIVEVEKDSKRCKF